MEHLATLARNMCIDRAAEAHESCKCDDWGIPLLETAECMINSIEVTEDGSIKGTYRLDLKTSFRVGDHVRLRSATTPKNAPFRKPRVLDSIVVRAGQGELILKSMEPPPPDRCSWYVLSAGNTTTTTAMMQAVRALAKEKNNCCGIFSKVVPGIIDDPPLQTEQSQAPSTTSTDLNLNASQSRAVSEAIREDLTLVWGPPGTGKTTTIVRIINQWHRSLKENQHILVAASTNNAVDNVLEKFVKESGTPDIDLVRVCPDSSSLSKFAQTYWVGAFVDGDINRPSAALKAAQKKVSEAAIIFTTCTGAALGLLRKLTFDFVIVDEASQITEPNCLIALVKGCQKAVLVGDHVQLRPTVTQHGAAYGYDVSLFERLYTGPAVSGMAKVMLETQYRMHPIIAQFPSTRFYEGKLLSGVTASDRQLTKTQFKWDTGPIKFVDSSSSPDGQESFFKGSKSNEKQAKICKHIVSQLQQPATVSDTDGSQTTRPNKLSIAVLTPYTAQLKLLKSLEKQVDSETISSVTVATVDSFQGREADIVVFCIVRCNVNRSIGFLADERRMNVALTRAKRGLIVVGHRETLVESLEGGGFWKSWFDNLK